MIPTHEVTAAVLTLLRTAGHPVHDLVAPSGAAAPYAVLEYPPTPGWTETDGGDIDDPEAESLLRYRIRSVGADPTAPATIVGSREQASRLAHKLRAVLLDRDQPIGGNGWVASSRFHEATGQVEAQGPVVNVSEDFVIWCVPA